LKSQLINGASIVIIRRIIIQGHSSIEGPSAVPSWGRDGARLHMDDHQVQEQVNQSQSKNLSSHFLRVQPKITRMEGSNFRMEGSNSRMEGSNSRMEGEQFQNGGWSIKATSVEVPGKQFLINNSINNRFDRSTRISDCEPPKKNHDRAKHSHP
jgi:hypothetical protein